MDVTKKTEIPWGPIGYATFKRTYARRLNENDANSPTEEFEDTIRRVITACDKQLKVGFTKEEEVELEQYMLSLKGIVAGRFLWQLGTKTVDKLGLLSLQNCAFTLVNEPVRPFTWAMDALMLGSGVGYNIQREHVYELPKVKKAKITRLDSNDADFIVPDSRAGWVELLQKVLEAHFITGKGFTYSTVCIRGKGTLIKSFGGLAAGPEELCWGMAEINKLLNTRANKKVRPIDCLDIMNIIGYIVVSGNVRRSAQIAIGDMDDLQFLSAKRWDLGNIPSWRAMSNNSVVCNDFSQMPEQFWEGYNGNGEPYGIINLANARRMGRVGETEYPDLDVQGFNPCAEQSLADKETCCLAELFLPNIESKEELFKVMTYLYRINKHSLRLGCHLKETEAIVHKNMRMGIGVTGYLQATEEQRKWLPEAYNVIRKYDKEYSAKHGFNESIKITTVKPSGTLSLLAGVTSGAHPAYSQYYIRRMRIATNSNLISVCKANGYPMEYQRNFDGTEDKSTMVVSFPCSVPMGTTLAKDMTAVDQLNIIKRLQTEWSDNSVSVTIYYRKHELEEIKEWLSNNYNDNIKTVSFLLHNEHGFQQAPLEEITEQQYNDLKALVTPISGVSFKEDDIIGSDECAAGVCPIK
jgi:ribonucleoside-triphosphate reductase